MPGSRTSEKTTSGRRVSSIPIACSASGAISASYPDSSRNAFTARARVRSSSTMSTLPLTPRLPPAAGLGPSYRARRTVDLQPSSVLLHVALGDRQPQAGALLAGGEERFAHRGEHVRRDPGAGVGDLHHDLASVPAAVHGVGAEPEPAAGGHGVERVGDQLEHRLLQLHRVHPYLREVRRQLHRQLDRRARASARRTRAAGLPPTVRSAPASAGRAPDG